MSGYSTRGLIATIAACFAAAACGGGQPPAPAEPAPEPEPAVEVLASYSGVDRVAFNRAAARLDLPLVWYQDVDDNGAIEPEETLALMFYSSRGDWVSDGRFTPAFHGAFQRIEAAVDGPDLEGLEPEEAGRRELVARELDQGRPTVVYNDLSEMSDEEKAVLEHLLAASRITDELYALQTGAAALRDRVPRDDPASRRLFDRNWGPECKAPRTEGEQGCSAIPGSPEPRVDVYPAEMQKDDEFCEKLTERDDAEELLDPFVAVREVDGELTALPYPEAYAELTGKIAAELEAAAGAIADPEEAALKKYLLAAAEGYRGNDWQPADEAWAAMNSHNSAWYVRAAPDETYWEPCNRKAGFHLTLARINEESLELQDRLTEIQQEMEDTLAELIGRSYRAREVAFHMPDFIEIVTNAGDDRAPMGAIIGQSLPNWGPVANEGRGRTVVMTNLYTDPDSEAIKRAKAESLLAPETMKAYPERDDAELIGVILHEASHNLGPSHEYRFAGKTDDEAFGGPLATVMEELKAQTGALYFVDLLREKGIIDDELARQAYTAAFNWACGHISRGMYTTTDRPKPYSQVSAIQLGFLMDEGAISFDAEGEAANGEDRGAFTLCLEKFPAAVQKLMKKVGRIKAKNQKKEAEKLIELYVDDEEKVHQELIAERILRHPKASFVYALDY